MISFNGALNKKQELPSKKPQTPKFSPKEEPRLTPIEADNSQKQANPYMSAKREGTFLSYQESDQNLNSSSKTVPVPIDIDAFNQKQGFEPTDIRVLQKEAQDYAMAMCQFEIPQWTKGVPTLEQLKSLKK